MGKKEKVTNLEPFAAYRQSLNERDKAALDGFFRDVEAHILLPRSEKNKMRKDFEDALLYFSQAGLPLPQALERLDAVHLGGFYARPAVLWYPLDDSAKIFPMAMEHGHMAVFRLSVYFRREVVPALLQMALTFTMKRFPGFATTLKAGFFWHYLDTSKRHYAVEREEGVPCRALPVERSGAPTFRVVYYGKRMSVEFFHILTDGNGALVFLKVLTAEYLRLLGVERTGDESIWNVEDTPKNSEAANEFRRSETREGISGFVDKLALQMSGKLTRVKPCRILHFKLDAAQLQAVARSKNATVTAYLLALQLLACKNATEEARGDISIRVPVNLRKFFPSDTVRNFSLFASVRLPIDEIADVETLLPEIRAQLERKANQAYMTEMMDSTTRLVDLIRYIPLRVKAPVTKKIYGFLGDGIFSNTLSNLGVVCLPPEMENEIAYMDFILGPSYINRASCGLVTFGNTAMLSITKTTLDPSFEEKLYSLLRRDGLTPEVEGSECYGG